MRLQSLYSCHELQQYLNTGSTYVAISAPWLVMVNAGLSQIHFGSEAIRNAINVEGDYTIHKLQRFLSTLGSIATITPLLGLLGTVIGIMQAFSTISENNIENILAHGISSALLTTVIGISIAIPALLAHRLLMRRSETLVLQIEQDIFLALKLHVQGFSGQSSVGASQHIAPTQPATTKQHGMPQNTVATTRSKKIRKKPVAGNNAAIKATASNTSSSLDQLVRSFDAQHDEST